MNCNVIILYGRTMNLSWCYFFRLFFSLAFRLSLFRTPNCLGQLDSQLLFILIFIFIVRIIKIVKVKERIIATIRSGALLSINNRFIVRINFAIIISFNYYLMMAFLALPSYMVVRILISNVLSVLFSNTSKKFSTELLKQMGLF